MLFAAALVFTGCSNGSDSGGGTPKHAVTFGVDGGNGTIKATVDGSEISSGDTVEKGKIVEFTATAENSATHNVDFWTVSAGAFEEGTGGSGSTIAKIKVVQPVSVTVKFKLKSAPPTKYAVTFGVEGGNGKLTAKADGIPETAVSPVNVEKNKTVTFTATPAANHKVKEWKVDGAVISNTTTTHTLIVTKAADVKVSFEALPAGQASYTVEHYREKADGTYPATPTESEDKSGTAGSPAVYTPKTYEGFTYKSNLTEINGTVQENGTIAADGSTVIKLYYERKTVNVTFKLAGGNIAGDTADVVKTGKYGTALEAPDPVQAGFVFKGWTPALPVPLVFPASNAEYTANWAQLYTIDFGVDGGHGTLTAEVDGTEIHSGDTVEQGKTVTFTAEAAPGYAVEKWTDGGSDIAGETNAMYSHTVTADADIAVHFKTVPVDVYVTGTSGGKGYVWKNDADTELIPNETGSNITVSPYAVRSLGKNVYITGEENVSGATEPRVWKKDGSLHWISDHQWSYAYDIAFYKGKILVAGRTNNGTDRGASITDISDPAHPEITFLCKETPPINYAEVRALCVGSGKLYAAGYKEDNTYKKTVFLWAGSDAGTMSELSLGLEGQPTYTNDIPYGVCTAGTSVYVAAGNLWKVDGAAVTPISVSGAKGLYALCVREGIVYAAGWTDDTGGSKAAVWKIEGTNVSLYKELSTDYSGVYALCAGRDDLYAAGFYYDTDNKYKPVWWHIAGDGTLTEHKRGIDKGAARGICVAAQE
ncbi:InlB B-repeat-containing protein [Treponema socranskii]|uniref:InlB B-repeat-containing protein n=1 Tax=Treponema socranskii TaxID=53419 RepID=UPI00287146D1|nr:hypothetical protein [Treponema socranskii]MDR9859289.1 hypothetical protein [Treponema socranskii]